MKKHFTSILGIFLLFLLPLTAQVGLNNQLVFVANLTGDQEVPAVTTSARGVASFVVSSDLTTLDIQGVFSGLSGPITASHIHGGAVGTNGGVLVNFSANITGNQLRASIALPPDFIEKALNNELYLNVHTAANPGGEIRGQLALQSEVFYGVGLSGAQEVPANTSQASAVGFLSYSPGATTARYQVVVNGLTGPPTASHIHAGAAGANGGVVAPLTIVSNSLIQGVIDLTALPADFFDKLETEGLYVNIHTAANPGGEIRGQLRSLGPIHFESFMNGDQENPPVTTNATGLAIAGLSADFTTLNYLVAASSITPTAGHFHEGAAGANGGVLVAFESGGLPNFYQGTATIPAGMAASLLNSGVYTNLHSAANPSGEIRGQVIPELRRVYAFDICGDQEVPITGVDAIGTAVVTHDFLNTNLDFIYIVDGLTGPATAAHIHSGAIGTSGGVLFPVATPTPVATGSSPIDGTAAALLASGDTYLNVHTAANPGGEVRGQVRMGTLCTLTSTDEISAVSELSIFPNPTSGMANLRFQSEAAFSGVLQVTNLTGRRVLTQDLKVEVGETTLQIDLENWSSGMYFGKIKSNDGAAIAFKIIKE